METQEVTGRSNEPSVFWSSTALKGIKLLSPTRYL